MSDLIERTAVLDLMRTNWADNDGDTAMQLSIDDVRNMPAASAVETPAVDAVSRVAVLEVVNNPLNIRLDKIIEGLPPVTPKPRTGKWKWKIGGYNDDFYVCDCGFKYVRVSPKYNYCPKCGAKMDGNMEGEGE